MHDQFSDKSFRVFAEKIRSFEPSAREFLKTAEVNYDDEMDLPESAFAWPEMRKFAMHTPEHTAMSMVYAHGENLPKEVTERLEKASELYGISGKIVASEEKTAEEFDDPSDYLIPQKNFGKITSKAMVKEASEFFSNNYKQMNLETRATAAATLVKKAKEYNCRISPTYYRHAGLTQSNPKVMEEWLEVRAELAQEEAHKNAFKKIAEYVGSDDFKSATRKDMIKLADTLAVLDEKANLVRRYDITLPDPLLTVFNTSKVAEESVNLGGKTIPVAALVALDPQTFGDVLGGDIVPEITNGGKIEEGKLVDVLKTLPADMQVNLVKTLGL